MRVAVVGAGIMGASAALALSERGHEVALFERNGFGSARGSSKGRSRVVRKAYPDPFYTQIMSEGYALWGDLEGKCGRKLVHEVGLLYFGLCDSPHVAAMTQGLAALDVPFRTLTPDQSAEKVPGLKLLPREIGIFTPEAGWVEADAAVRETLRLAKSQGVCFEQTYADPARLLERFDRVVLCAGALVRRTAPIEVRTSVQTFAYLHGAQIGSVWIEDGPEGIYGFPSEGTDSFKVGYHKPDTPLADVDAYVGADDAPIHQIEAIVRAVTKRFPGRPPEVASVNACIYTNAPNEDFKIGFVGERMLVVSACSGHGFKFGPWVGRLAARACEQPNVLNAYPRFALGTLGQ